MEEEGARERGRRESEREEKGFFCTSPLSLSPNPTSSSAPSPPILPTSLSLSLYSSRTIAFFSRLATVSLGCAPTASHFLIAGALRLVSFLSGS